MRTATRRRSGDDTLASMASAGRCFPWLWSARVRVQEMGGGDSKEMSRERDFSEDWIRKLLKIAFF
jgi:hypothetical protein